MKDSEFIELLNLYLDHEISAADAARLEAEVQRNPARRQIYRQYCQMQKACSMLVEDFAAEPASDKLVAFEQPQPARAAWRSLVWGVGGLAAAACVAFVWVQRAPEVVPPTAPQVAVVEPPTPPPATEARAIARTVTMPARQAELQPALTAGSLRLANNQGGLVMAAPAQFQWMDGVKIVPLPQTPSVDELLRFEKHQTMKPEPAVFRSNRPIQGNVEMTAFQFQK